MIVLRNRTSGEIAKWPENTPYNGRQWQAIDSTTTQEIGEMEKAFSDEGLLLGNAIAKATSLMGFTPCPTCKRRQEWLNEFHKRGVEFVKETVKKLKGSSD